MTHNCGALCTTGWGASRKCHCGACGQDFSVVAHFDKHRPKGECLSPTTIGLVLNDRGVWTKPGEVDFVDRLTTKGKA